MSTKYLNFICIHDTFRGTQSASIVPFDADTDYALLTAFFDGCPECQSFPKEEYFDGDWYVNWEDHVIWADGRIAARAGIWKFSDDRWEVAGVITHPEYRQRGYSTRLVAHCTARILLQGKTAFLSTAESNRAMQCVAEKVGFVPEK